MLRDQIKKIIQDIAQEQGIEVNNIKDEDALVEDIGFASLDIATLVSHLEAEFDVNPFIDRLALMTDIRTVGDFCGVYESTLSGNAKPEAIVSPEELQRGSKRRQAAARRRRRS